MIKAWFFSQFRKSSLRVSSSLIAIFLFCVALLVVHDFLEIQTRHALLTWLRDWKEIFWVVAQIGVLVLGIYLLLRIVNWLEDRTDGIRVAPFSIHGVDVGQDGQAISDFLISELQRIRRIHSVGAVQVDTPSSVRRVHFLPVTASTENLSESLSNIGTVGVGESKVSIGHILLTVKQLSCSTGGEQLITGWVRRVENLLVVSGKLEYRGQILTWTVEGDDSQVSIRDLIQNLAYKMARDISLQHPKKLLLYGLEPPTVKSWEAFKYFTEAIHFCGRYTRYQSDDDIVQASENWKKAFDIESDYDKLYDLAYNIGLAHYAQQDYSPAMSMFLNASQITRHDSRAYFGLGNVYVAQGKYQDAIKHYKKALLFNHKDAYCLNALANIYSQQGRYKEGEEACKKSIAADRRYAWPHNNWAHILWQQGRYEEAVKKCNKALAKARGAGQHFPWPYNTRGYIRYLQGKSDQAERDFRTALKLDPRFDWPYHNLGLLRLEQENYEEALIYLEQALECSRAKYAAFHFNCGIAQALYANDVESAVPHWMRGLRASVNSVQDQLRRNIYVVILDRKGRRAFRSIENIRSILTGCEDITGICTEIGKEIEFLERIREIQPRLDCVKPLFNESG